jgi:hypothetical protein
MEERERKVKRGRGKERRKSTRCEDNFQVRKRLKRKQTTKGSMQVCCDKKK